ncbi:2-amino-4-hydroxy-6-hydroxymethyldihydropteridine diphosphokinase [Sphingomonas oleivorans]|uniref:2-amino-4-hydroxy-6-hydroxymethyldihydropteridine pyrophosphokinase n=1 Tax=Sphingomonas oleivorans TaxID=1735121 RepID=A0A2T5G192_9SPHN|nr:2-amino-4-hydroxy-6-hydroxymethyldihydropteridine diphosphokinase [Sphingomonas oleivorans]PTQ12915.1 2-amino-4-hydroxy-6-hydroxymethyldihydropteridine diphosphokinase [Sphingomonas oleivorans]
MVTTSYAIALGSNRRHGRHGAPAKVLAAAVATMRAEGLVVTALSPMIATPALGPAGRGFANAAALIETRLDPPALLALLKRIEQRFGRRPGRRWGARVLDLDIVLWSGGTWPPTPRGAAPGRLRVPHRELAQRAFVLAPLAAVAAGWRDPRSGRTVRQMLAQLRR